MHDPATSETWQTALGKDFGGMAQVDDERGQQGTNSIFVMTHDEIACIPKKQTVTYACVVVDLCPQKADPHCIQITTGGNLINYLSKLSTRTADLTTSKMMCNSVLSTEGAFDRTVGQIRIYEDAVSFVPRIDQKTILFEEICIKQIR